MATVQYQLSNILMSRKGTLTLNISPDGYGTVSDYYNYSEIDSNTAQLLAFSTSMEFSQYDGGQSYNYVYLTCSSFSTVTSQLQFNINLTV